MEHKDCNKAEFDAKLAALLASTPTKGQWIKLWTKPLKEPHDLDCPACREWSSKFTARTIELMPNYELTKEERKRVKKRLTHLTANGGKLYFNNSIIYRFDDDIEQPVAAAVAAAAPVENRWRIKGGDSRSAEAKTAVVQRLPLFLLCCGCMPAFGLIQGLILFPFGAVIGLVISTVIMAGFVFRSLQYFFYFSDLGIGYKVFYCWLPFLLVIATAPIVFVGSLIYGLITSLILPPVWMIKYDSWWPAVATLDWQYNEVLPKVWESTFGSRGAELAIQQRPSLEKGLRMTVGVLLIVPLQALLLATVLGPIFGAGCGLMLLVGLPLRSFQWYWVYGAFKDWSVGTAPFWLFLAPFWLIATAVAPPIALVLSLLICPLIVLIMPFYHMIDKGEVFPVITVCQWVWIKGWPKIWDSTLGGKAKDRVTKGRLLFDLHCWWLPCIPFAMILGFVVWMCALLVLLLLRFVPFYCWMMHKLWKGWYRKFDRPVDGKERLSAAAKRLGWLIVAIPMALFSAFYLVIELPIGLICIVFISFTYGLFRFPYYVLRGQAKESYADFYSFYKWTNKHYMTGKHTGCLFPPK